MWRLDPHEGVVSEVRNYLGDGCLGGGEGGALGFHGLEAGLLLLLWIGMVGYAEFGSESLRGLGRGVKLSRTRRERRGLRRFGEA